MLGDEAAAEPDSGDGETGPSASKTSLVDTFKRRETDDCSLSHQYGDLAKVMKVG